MKANSRRGTWKSSTFYSTLSFVYIYWREELVLAAESRVQMRGSGKLKGLSNDRNAASQLTSLTLWSLKNKKRLPELAGLLTTSLTILSFCWRQKRLKNCTRVKKASKSRTCPWFDLQKPLGRKTTEEKICKLCCAVKEKAQNKFSFLNNNYIKVSHTWGTINRNRAPLSYSFHSRRICICFCNGGIFFFQSKVRGRQHNVLKSVII